ncbi:MAG: VWA domain-containing protein [bacterium]|nr:VWA domain-containing protein [bacterium]
MNFAAPLAFGLAALAAPILVLYILKVKRRKVQIPYLRLWEQLLVETRARSLFKRLKRLYSLLLQLLILAALMLALTQPAVELSSVNKESIVLLLDTSASMQALEDVETGRTRFDAMVERASEFVEGRSFEDEMMVVAVSDRIDVLCSFNRNTIQLRDALEKIAPSNGPFNVDKAYSFAREVTANRDEPVILFLSDGAAGAVQTAIEGDDQADLVPVGEATENVGIVRFSARKNTSLGTDYILGVIKNFGEEEAEFRYEIAINQATERVVPKTLAPGEELKIEEQLVLNQGATIQLTIDNDDALAIDNKAWAVVRPTRLRKVVLVAADEAVAQPFMIALQAMREVVSEETFAVTAANYGSLSDEEKLADVTICVDAIPDDLPARGNLILMNSPIPDSIPARITGTESEPAVWDWDREHLLNRYLNWRDLPIPPANIVKMQAGTGTALVSSYEGPLISAFEMADRMAVYVAFDMTAKLFPFRLAFPMLLRNAIAWFEVEEDLLIEADYAVGDTIQPLRRIPDQQVGVTFFRDGQVTTRKVDTREGMFYFNETDEPGGYLFRVSGVNVPVSVNLFDAGESRIAPDELDPAKGDALEAEQGRHLFNRDLWTLLALLGLILWSLEWAFYHRRITE